MHLVLRVNAKKNSLFVFDETVKKREREGEREIYIYRGDTIDVIHNRK